MRCLHYGFERLIKLENRSGNDYLNNVNAEISWVLFAIAFQGF